MTENLTTNMAAVNCVYAVYIVLCTIHDSVVSDYTVTVHNMLHLVCHVTITYIHAYRIASNYGLSRINAWSRLKAGGNSIIIKINWRRVSN